MKAKHLKCRKCGKLLLWYMPYCKECFNEMNNKFWEVMLKNIEKNDTQSNSEFSFANETTANTQCRCSTRVEIGKSSRTNSRAAEDAAERFMFPHQRRIDKKFVGMELYDSKKCQSLKKQIEETDSIKKRHILINRYLAERIRRVEVVMTREFPDEVSYEEMIECLWEDLKLAQRHFIHTYSKAL